MPCADRNLQNTLDALSPICMILRTLDVTMQIGIASVLFPLDGEVLDTLSNNQAGQSKVSPGFQITEGRTQQVDICQVTATFSHC